MQRHSACARMYSLLNNERISSAVDDAEDYDDIFNDEINDPIREPFYEVVSCSLITRCEYQGISGNEAESCVNAKEKIVAQPASLVFIPHKSSSQVFFSLGPDKNLIFHVELLSS